MAWDRFLQSDQLTAPTSKTIFYSYDGWGKPLGFSTTSSVSNVANLGSKRVSYLNWTKPPDKRAPFWPQNPAIHYRIEVECEHAEATLYYVTAGKLLPNRKVSGTLSGFAASHPLGYGGLPPLDAVATAYLVSAIARSKEASADVGMMLAESGETLSMLRGPLDLLRSPRGLAQLLPRRTTRLTMGAMKYAANAWLTARYGIIPLLSDVDAIRSKVRSGFNNPHYRYSKAGRDIVTMDVSSKVNGGAGVPNCWWWGTRSTKISMKYRARSYFADTLSANAELGLDACSILPTLYELIPYSFVLDWFVDVGSWLRAIVPKPGIAEMGNYLSASNVREDITDVWGLCASPSVSASWPLSPSGGRCLCTSTAYQRGINLSVPMYPALNVNLSSWKRKLDGVTLMYQRLPILPRR